PHYLAPVPSMAVIQLDLGPGQAEMTSGHTVPRGAGVESESIQGEPCRFRTCYPVTLWPIDVRFAGLVRPPFSAPETPASTLAPPVSRRPPGLVRMSSRCGSTAANLADFPLQSLRFFLKGQPQHVFALYELLFNNLLEVAVAASPRTAPVLLPPDCIRPVGFE